MKKKVLSFILCALTAASVMVPMEGVTAFAAVEKNARIKVWTSDAKVKAVKTIAAKFKKKYSGSNIKISVKVMNEAEAGTMLLADSEAAADVLGVACDQIGNLNHAGVAAPLSASDKKSVKKNNCAVAAKAVTSGKKMYAFPYSLNGYYMVYDKRVVSAKKAKNLESVLAACKKKGKKFIMDAGNGYYTAMFLFTGGLKLKGLESDGVTQKFNNYSEKKIVASMKAFSKLFHKYKGTFKSLAVSNIPSGFASGKVGAGIDGGWDEAVNKLYLGKNYGAAKLPKIKISGSKKQIKSLMGVMGFAVNSASKYPKTSMAFAKYLTTKASQKILFKKSGNAPTNKSLQKSSAVKKSKGPAAIIKQSKYSQPQSEIGRIWDPFANLGNKITAGGINPDTYDYKKLFKRTIENILDY